jgi:hypothetical protein
MTEADLLNLIDARVMEGRTVEYKEALPGGADSEKKEFLADVSSFANTSGGNLYFGIREAEGIPVELIGLDMQDVDAEIQRLENLIRDGIEPRLPPLRIEIVELLSSRAVIVMTIPRSWALPHAVKASGRFHARHSTGKYPLDVGELRRLFIQSESLPERMRNFRRDRIALIEAGESPLTKGDKAKIILHVLPLQAFSSGPLIDFTYIDERVLDLSPISGYGTHSRHNFDGLLHYSVTQDTGNTVAYTQLFRNGCIETVDTFLLSHGDRRYIPSQAFEAKIAKALGSYLKVMRDLEVQTPVYVALALLRVDGYYMAVSNDLDTMRVQRIDRSELLLPEIAIEKYGSHPYTILRPLFDIVWNAAGWPRSMNYDEEGNRIMQ